MRGLTFRIGDIPVRVDLTFWVIMGLFGFQRATLQGRLDIPILIEWVALVFTGILLHEMGHAISFRAFGRKPSVVLYGMGGLTSAQGALTPGKRLITTLAGPFFGFALSGVILAVFAAGLWRPELFADYSVGELLGASLPFPAFAGGRLAEQILLDLIFINLGWGILNLIPLHPLDGGQSLEAGLALLRVKKAAMITSAIGVVIASAVGVYALRSGSIFLLLIMIFLGMSNVRRLTALRNPAALEPRSSERETPLSPELQRTVSMADQALGQGREEEAVEMIQQEHTYRPSTESARAYLTILARTQRFDEIEQFIHSDIARMDPSTLSSAAAALVAGGRYEAALRAAEQAWNTDQGRNWQPAVTAAGARAGLRDVDGAIRWLYMAADHGWNDRRRLESDPLFAEVRGDQRMGDLLSRMGV